mmetsp:Transcript_63312/g.137753  ORF Transcript_63312/g.137753 Transcript_63312/m.137753 type:complete len:99 (+) Transcript_63312:953-1249(+)
MLASSTCSLPGIAAAGSSMASHAGLTCSANFRCHLVPLREQEEQNRMATTVLLNDSSDWWNHSQLSRTKRLQIFPSSIALTGRWPCRSKGRTCGMAAP